jgi:hypothetical protein
MVAKQGKGSEAEGPAVTALKSHGWKPVTTDSMGAVTYAHPNMGARQSAYS